MIKQIAGWLSLIGLLVAFGSLGWWWLTRGNVIDTVNLANREQVRVSGTEGSGVAVGGGRRHPREWQVGPYNLSPDDNPVNVSLRLRAAGEFTERRDTFTAQARMLDANNNEVWDQRSSIRPTSRTRDEESTASQTEANFGMVHIPRAGEYTFLCNVVGASMDVGSRSGWRRLDFVIRGQAKPFPIIPVAGGLLLTFVMVFAFGEKVKKGSPRQETAEPDSGGADS